MTEITPPLGRPLTISFEMTNERIVTYSLERAQRHAASGEPIAETLARAEAIEAWLRGRFSPSARAG